MITVVVDHTNELAKLFWGLGASNVQDSGDLLRLRLNTFRSNGMAKVLYALHGKGTFFWLDRKVGLGEAGQNLVNILEMLLKRTLGKDSKVINEALNKLHQVAKHGSHDCLGIHRSNFDSHGQPLVAIFAKWSGDCNVLP
jgi:hypothetical protein